MAEADPIRVNRSQTEFGSCVRYCNGETQVANVYLDQPKAVATQKALELAALLSVLSYEPENVTSLNENLRNAFFGHLDELGHQVLALTELVEKQ